MNYKPGVELRRQFPIFDNARTDRPLAYLDSAASSQKPVSVIERIGHYYTHEHANIHRGAYRLSAVATQTYESARKRVSGFINAKNSNSIIFTRGTTESVNLVAHSAESWFRPGDSILLSLLEHHSNIVPWQLLAHRKKLNIHFIDINPDGSLNIDDLNERVKTLKPKLCAVTHTSNALGSIVPLNDIVPILRKNNCLIFVDAAQAAAHTRLDVQLPEVDFLAFSGHKAYGPTGVGVLYVREELLEKLEPFQGGGDMIETVSVNGSTWAAAPQKFEAGTPAIAAAVGLETALDFINKIGFSKIAEHKTDLLNYGLEKLQHINSIKIYGPAVTGGRQAGIISFNLAGIHAHDLATVADTFNVQFRAGHHCAMPLLHRLNIQASARISFGVYSCREDIDQLIESLNYAIKLFS